VRLQRYIKEAEELLSKPIEGGTMEEEELILEDLIERMNNNVSVIERCNANRTSLLRDLKGEAKVTEEQEHSHVIVIITNWYSRNCSSSYTFQNTFKISKFGH